MNGLTRLSLNPNLLAIPFSAIRRMREKAEQMEAAGKEVIHFEIGRPDFDTPAHIKEAAKKALDAGFVHYTGSSGMPELRKALAEHILDYKGVAYDPATEIIVTAGGQEALYLALNTLLQHGQGEEVLVPDPGFVLFQTCVRLAGGEPVFVPLVADQGFCWDIDCLRKVISPKTKGIIINSPHNPTGAVHSCAHLEQLAAIAKEHNLVVLSDEAYDRILYDNHKFCSIASLPEMRERTLIAGSLSKTYSMTGWRIGYLAGPAEFIRNVVKLHQNVMLSLCSFAQQGAVAALKGSQEPVNQMVAEFARRREVILQGLETAPGLSCVAPGGAFYVFVKHDTRLNSFELVEYLLAEAGVATVPGPEFGTGGEGYFRLSFATSLAKCQSGVARIAKAMEKLTRSS